MPMLSTRGSASARSLALDGPQRARRSFVYVSNALQTFTVPANVTLLTLEVAGGGGGGSSDTVNTGGGGGADVVSGQLSVSPAATYYVAAAQAGFGQTVEFSPSRTVFDFAGGWPGGGGTGTGSLNYPEVRSAAGSGGGYSGIFSANALTQGNVVVVAAGGGGSSNNTLNGTNGGNATTGAGGTSGGGSAGAGAALQGGVGDNYALAGGVGGAGGGGGYYGGGGSAGPDTAGSGVGSGGRGSSYYPSLSTSSVATAANSQPGYVTIAW